MKRDLSGDPGPFIASVDEVASLRRDLARRDLDLAQAMAEAARHEAAGKAMAGEMEKMRAVFEAAKAWRAAFQTAVDSRRIDEREQAPLRNATMALKQAADAALTAESKDHP